MCTYITYVVHSSCKSHANHAFLCWPVILNVVGSHGGVGDAVVDHSIDADGDRVTRQHLLWRYIKWHRPEVHFLVAVRTWNDEKNTRPLGAPCGLKDGWTYFHCDSFQPTFSQPSKPEDHRTLVFGHHLDASAERKGQCDNHKEQGQSSQYHGTKPGAFGVGCK